MSAPDGYAAFVVRRLAELGIYGDTDEQVRDAIVEMWALEHDRALEGVASLVEWKQHRVHRAMHPEKPARRRDPL